VYKRQAQTVMPFFKDRTYIFANNLIEELRRKKYHIIAGAFLVPNNAERQKKEMEKRGLQAEVLPKRGDYFMVSLGSYDTQQEATKAMNELSKSLDKQLWIMKK
jgi:cell division protein FtsN